MYRNQLLRPVMALSLLAGLSLGTGWRATPSYAAPPVLVVPMAGTLSGEAGDSIDFSGHVKITSTPVLDDTTGRPSGVILTFDLLNITGIERLTKERLVSTGKVTRTRLFTSSDQLDIPFAFFSKRPQGAVLARAGQVSFRLAFDSDGGLTEAIASPSTLPTP